jgi:hypothetical protein
VGVINKRQQTAIQGTTSRKKKGTAERSQVQNVPAHNMYRHCGMQRFLSGRLWLEEVILLKLLESEGEAIGNRQ